MRGFRKVLDLMRVTGHAFLAARALACLGASLAEAATPWSPGEAAFVHQVLEGNADLAKQRLQGDMTRADLEAAQRARLPRWSLTASAEYQPQAEGPVSASGVAIPGQTLLAAEATAGVIQALPTGGEVGAALEGGEMRPRGGAWQDTQAVRVHLTQPLLKGFGARSDVHVAMQQAQIDARLAQADLRAKLLDLIGDARSAYWNLALRAHQLKALQADSIYWSQALRAAEARHRLGDLAEDEFLRYRIQALGSRQTLLEGRQSYRQALAGMAVLLSPASGPKPRDAYMGQGDSLAAALGLNWDLPLGTLPEMAYDEVMRWTADLPTLKRLAHLRERSELALARARDNRKPSLNLSASWRKPIGGESDTRLGAAFAWEWPSIEAERSLRKTWLEMEAQKLDSLQTRRGLEQNLARLFDQFSTGQERFRLAREKVELERIRSRIAERRHAMGDLDFTELQLSARDRLAAEQDVAAAYVSLRLLTAEAERWNGSALAKGGVRLEGEGP